MRIRRAKPNIYILCSSCNNADKMDEKEAKEIEKELRTSGDNDVFYNYEVEHNGSSLTLTTTEDTTIYQVCLTKVIRVKNEFNKWIRIDTDEDGKLQIIIHD